MDESGPKDIRKSIPTEATVFLNIFNSVTHLFLGAAACSGFCVGFMFFPGVYRTHIFLTTTGYIIMMSLAVLTLSPHTGWTKGITNSHKKLIHGAMQVIGAVLAISGSVLILNVTDRFYWRAHSICGICALACLCLNFLCGIVNVFSLKIPSVQRIVQIGHSLFGICTLLFAFLTVILGYDIMLYYGANRGFVIYAIIMIVIAMIGVVTSAVMTAMRRMCCFVHS